MQSLYEKYRPQRLSQVVGQAKAVRQIKAVLSRGWGGRAFWIAGDSGTGKTTLAKIIAREGADDFFIEEFDSPAALMHADTAERIERSMHLYAPGKGGRAFIINEAHGLRKPEIRWLLGILERIPNHIVFVFTTTYDGQSLWRDFQTDASPLFSRCIQIDLTNDRGLTRAFASRAKQIAKLEKLDGKPRAAYGKLATDCHNNLRMMLQKIEYGGMLKTR